MPLVRWYAAIAVVLAALPLAGRVIAPASAPLYGTVAMAVSGVLLLAAMVYTTLRRRPVPVLRLILLVTTVFWVCGLPFLAATDNPALVYTGLALQIAGYVSIGSGVWILGRIHHARNDLDSWADSVVLVVAVCIVVWWCVSVIGLADHGPQGAANVHARVVLILADMSLAGAYLRFVTLLRERTAGVRLLGLAVVAVVVGDIVGMSSPGVNQESPALAVTCWVISWNAFGLFAVHPSSEALTSGLGGPGRADTLPITGPRILLLWATALVPGLATAFLDVDGLRLARVWPLPSAMLAVFVLVLVRLARALLRVERDARQLAVTADRDELTGLPNRRATERFYAEQARTVEGRRRPPAVGILDLDRFKVFNDTRGHLQGDVLLREAAAAWSQALPPGMVLGRHGGEEFVLVAPGRDADQLAVAVDDLRGHTPMGQTFSAGVAQARSGEGFTAVVARADACLYAAKRAGRNRSVVDGAARWTRRAPTRSVDRRQAERTAGATRTLAVAAVSALLLVLYPLLPAVAQQWAYLASFAVALVGVLSGPLARHRFGLRSRVLFGLVALSWLVYVVGIVAGGPTVGGLTLARLGTIGLHLALVPLALSLEAGRAGDRTAWIDSAVVFSALSLLVLWLVVEPVGVLRGFAAPDRGFIVALVALSIVVVGVLVQGVLSHTRPPLALPVLLAAAVVQLVGDVERILEPAGQPSSPLWMWLKAASLLLLAIGATHPSAARLTDAPTISRGGVGARRLVVLGLTGALPALLLAHLVLTRGGAPVGQVRAGLVAVALTDVAVVTLVVVRLRALLGAQTRLGERLEHVARTDPLTGLPNRRAARERLGELLHAPRAADPRDPFAAEVVVAMLDLDHFKAYNDRHGHPAGDDLLRSTAAAWSEVLGPADVLYRVGGEEFLLVCPGRSMASTIHLADELRAVTPDGQTHSAGVAAWDGSESRDHLLGRADEALYRSKEAGRARTTAAESRRRPPTLRPAVGGEAGA